MQFFQVLSEGLATWDEMHMRILFQLQVLNNFFSPTPFFILNLEIIFFMQTYPK